MELKELMTKEFFIYIFFKLLSICFITISLFSIFFREEKNIFLGGLLFVIGFIFLILTSLTEKPKLATCLDKSGFLVSFFINTSLHLCIAMIGLFYTFDFRETLFDEKMFFIVLIVIFATSTFAYLYCCKKNFISKEEKNGV